MPRRAIEDVASSAPVTADTVPADLESTMLIYSVPASSGRVRAACARVRRPRRDESQARGRFAVLSSDDDDTRQGVIHDTMEVFDSRSSRCAIHHGCHAQGGSSCIGTT